MVASKTKIINAQGMHMRPASELVKALAPFESKITIKLADKVLDAKSLLNIMAAGLKVGTEFEIVCDGVDEVAALKTAIDMVESGFGE